MKFSLSLLLLSVGLVLCPALGSGRTVQSERTRIAGTWVLDVSKSKGDESVEVRNSAKETIIVSLSGPEIRMVITSETGGGEQILTLFTDGRAGNNSTNSEARPLATWNGRKLVVKTILISKTPRPDGSVSTAELTDEWELSKDGRILMRAVTLIELNPVPESRAVLKGDVISPKVEVITKPGRKILAKLKLGYKRVA